MIASEETAQTNAGITAQIVVIALRALATMHKFLKCSVVACFLILASTSLSAEAESDDEAIVDEQEAEEETSEASAGSSSSTGNATGSSVTSSTSTASASTTFKPLKVTQKLKPNSDVDLPQDI